MIIKALYSVVSLTFLVYLIWPGPSSITDFPALPDSSKSTLEGDTVQVPNVAGYFSNNYRDFVTNFYKQVFWQRSGLPFPPIRLNYPPEYAFTYIKDQTQSTYLEEYVYPLRASLFVNGLEPFLSTKHEPRFQGATSFYQDKYWDTKVTLRYYPSSIFYRLIVWLGINLSVIGLYILGKRVLYGRA